MASRLLTRLTALARPASASVSSTCLLRRSTRQLNGGARGLSSTRAHHLRYSSALSTTGKDAAPLTAAADVEEDDSEAPLEEQEQEQDAQDEQQEVEEEPDKVQAALADSSQNMLFIPLGGCSEVGMNSSLYGRDNRYVMVDFGMSFDDSLRFPGVNGYIPDTSYVTANLDKLEAIIVTHGHEDHIGGLASMWETWRKPIYCSKLAAAMIKERFTKACIEYEDDLFHVVEPGTTHTVGPFDVQFESMCHSIPESMAVIFKTRDGNVFHSGDWKFDDNPVIGQPTDYARLEQIGNEGVLAMLSDSTNASSEGTSQPEKMVADGLKQAVQNCDPEGLIVASCFSSSIARVQALVSVAHEVGRVPVLLGTAMTRMAAIAESCGYAFDALVPQQAKDSGQFTMVTATRLNTILQNLENSDFVLNNLAKKNVMLIATGCQGERLASVPRIAEAGVLKDNDTVILSSRTIPGNETPVRDTLNNLRKQRVRTILPDDGYCTHVSGHPYRGDIRKMLGLLRPQHLIPIHGEYIHLEDHALLADTCGVGSTAIPDNGLVFSISKDGIERVGRVPCGIQVLESDGSTISVRATDSYGLRGRRILQTDGVCTVSAVFSENNVNVLCSIAGFGAGQRPPRNVHAQIADCIKSQWTHAYNDGARQKMSRHVQNIIHKWAKKRPLVILHVVKLGQDGSILKRSP